MKSMESSELNGNEGGFSRGLRRQMIEDFVVGYYNGSVKANLAEKDPMSGRDVEFLMDGRQFEKTNKSEVWSSSGAIGTGYQHRVVYRDKRFSGLDQLLGMYSGTIVVAEEDKPLVEQRLYEMVLLLVKEGRLPKAFKVLPATASRIDRLDATVERLTKALESLEKRVKSIEDGPAH